MNHTLSRNSFRIHIHILHHSAIQLLLDDIKISHSDVNWTHFPPSFVFRFIWNQKKLLQQTKCFEPLFTNVKCTFQFFFSLWNKKHLTLYITCTKNRRFLSNRLNRCPKSNFEHLITIRHVYASAGKEKRIRIIYYLWSVEENQNQ